MGDILYDGTDAGGRRGMAEGQPERWDAWLDGVTTFDGKPGLDAVKKSLGL